MFQADSNVWVRAVGDKVLTPDGVRYLLVWDYDEKTFTPLQETIILASGMDVFPTENGYHLYARGLHLANERKEYQTFMGTAFPSDYHRGRTWSFIRPASKEEASYIRAITGGRGKWVRYYRDKNIWAGYEAWLGKRLLETFSYQKPTELSHINVLDSGWKTTPTPTTGMN